MPTYVYRCLQCGATLERRQGFQEAPLTICEECGGELRRVLQPVGVIFRGSGFYSTDYRNASRGTRDEGKTEAAKSDDHSASGSDKSTAPTPASSSGAASSSSSSSSTES